MKPHPPGHDRDNSTTPVGTPSDDAIALRSAPDAGIFDLARLQQPPADWKHALLPAVLVWIGTLDHIGQHRETQLSRILGDVADGAVVFYLCFAASLAFSIVQVTRGKKQPAVLWITVVGYFTGHLVSNAIPDDGPGSWSIPFRQNGDAIGFASVRLTYGLAVGACTLAALYASSRWLGVATEIRLGIGDWGAVGRDFTCRSKPVSYVKSIPGFLLFALSLFFVVQSSVGFAPIRSGSLWSLFPAVLLAALVNASVEELVFRGTLQPAFVQSAGLAHGLWIQGLLFGMLHWGNSIGFLSALPTSLLIGVGAVYWGKAAIETRGLSWVIMAHTLVDIAIMAGWFVPHRSS